MKKPDLLILVSIWEFIAAFLAFICIVAIAVFAFPAVLGVWGDWGYSSYGMMNNGDMPRVGAIFGLSIAILFLLCFMALAIIGGIGLLMGKEWGRITGIVHSALSVLCFPIGTIIGVLAVIYLTKPEVKDYFIPPLKT
ncbi:MAG: hypothetical protein PHY28_06505 [Dehalococcoidales bacterium]|nr:hypothetical protein [Dehalococcoidales bacterium]